MSPDSYTVMRAGTEMKELIVSSTVPIETVLRPYTAKSEPFRIPKRALLSCV